MKDLTIKLKKKKNIRQDLKIKLKINHGNVKNCPIPAKPCRWSELQDEELKLAIHNHGTKWKLVSEAINNNRTAEQCSQRWKYIKPQEEKKNVRWLPEHDQILLKYIKQYGKNWTYLAELLKRTPKQVRDRFTNYLNDSQLNSVPFGQEEDRKLIKLIQENGFKWNMFAQKMKKSENFLKNRFYGNMKKKFQPQDSPYYNLVIQREQSTIEPSSYSQTFEGKSFNNWQISNTISDINSNEQPYNICTTQINENPEGLYPYQQNYNDFFAPNLGYNQAFI